MGDDDLGAVSRLSDPALCTLTFGLAARQSEIRGGWWGREEVGHGVGTGSLGHGAPQSLLTTSFTLSEEPPLNQQTYYSELSSIRNPLFQGKK